jgi:hypothetical protein
VEGRPRLHVAAARFTVLFRSDGSNNDWGFKLFAEAVLAPLPPGGGASTSAPAASAAGGAGEDGEGAQAAIAALPDLNSLPLCK